MSDKALSNPCFIVTIGVENLDFGDGKTTEYTLKQIDPLYAATPPTARNGIEARFDLPPISIGPVSVAGYIDTDTWEAGIVLSVIGIKLATLYGSLKDGINANIDLIAAKGSVKFYMKPGNEVWVDINLSLFGKEYNKSAKIYPFNEAEIVIDPDWLK